jgi:hypothetical protein
LEQLQRLELELEHLVSQPLVASFLAFLGNLLVGAFLEEGVLASLLEAYLASFLEACWPS